MEGRKVDVKKKKKARGKIISEFLLAIATALGAIV